MDNVKLSFIKEDFPSFVAAIAPDSVGKWGKMNAQQMVEHVTGFFKISTNKLHFPLVTPFEHLPKYKEFLLSDKEFRENTKAPVLPDKPFPVRNSTMNDSVNELKKEIADFIHLFETEKGLMTQHPVFGDLNFEEWVLLHYKHVLHHAKQFGLR